jgi:hypothetical protein
MRPHLAPATAQAAAILSFAIPNQTRIPDGIAN